MAQKPDKQTSEEREARRERLRQLLHERGEDAAKTVRTWLQQGINESRDR